MDYWKFTCHDFEDAGLMVAFLSQYPFDSFEESATEVSAYLPIKEDVTGIEIQLELLKTSWHFRFDKQLIPFQNWNKKWEENFTPIVVDDFCCIRADFHETPVKVEHELVINPKMAFGTGHHETTRLVIKSMRNINFKNKKVLDYGCGTGILAFLAEKLGATEIDAVEIEQPAHENAVENAGKNNMKNISIYCGTLIDVPEKTYDIILANINRNVILDSLSALKVRIANNGLLLLSGFLLEDIPMMKDKLEQKNFEVINQSNEQNWVCLTVKNA